MKFSVSGVPQPKGSLFPVTSRTNGQVFLKESNEKTLRPWRKAFTAAARLEAQAQGWRRHPGPVAVRLRFRLPRPATISVALRLYPTVKPDLDKLTRTILDCLKVAGVYADDALVVQLSCAKVYAPGEPGVDVEVVAV